MRGNLRFRAIASLCLLTGMLAVPAPASAQDCPIVSSDEVQTAMGVTGLEGGGSSSATFCGFAGGDTSLYVSVTPGSYDETRAAKPDAPDVADITVADHPAFVSGTDGYRSLVVGLPSLMLSLDYSGPLEATDAQAKLTSLAELIIPRLPTGPSDEDIAYLDGILPDTAGGTPLKVAHAPGSLVFGSLDPNDPEVAAFIEALAAHGLTMADVPVGLATSGSGTAVAALRFRGADASTLIDAFAQASNVTDATITKEQVAGRDVVAVRSASNASYLLPIDDVIVLVIASEPALTEIMTALP